MKKTILLLSLFFASCGPSESVGQQKFDALQLLSDIKELSSDEYGGRETGTPGSVKAQAYIIERFVKYGLIPFEGNYKQPFEFEHKTKTFKGNNIVGYIKGKKYPDSYMVITGHYDHLGEHEGEVFNGADDNASGVAGMFAVADYYTKHSPLHSIVFVAFDAEEKGLKGAAHFVTNPPFPAERMALNINMDMISRNEKSELYAAGTYHSPFLKKYIEKAAEGQLVTVKIGHDKPKEGGKGDDDWTYASDHGAFYKANIPFIYFGVEDHKDYHKASDVFESINQVFFVNCVNFIIDVASVFDKNMESIIKETEAINKKREKKSGDQ